MIGDGVDFEGEGGQVDMCVFDWEVIDVFGVFEKFDCFDFGQE